MAIPHLPGRLQQGWPDGHTPPPGPSIVRVGHSWRSSVCTRSQGFSRARTPPEAAQGCQKRTAGSAPGKAEMAWLSFDIGEGLELGPGPRQCVAGQVLPADPIRSWACRRAGHGNCRRIHPGKNSMKTRRGPPMLVLWSITTMRRTMIRPSSGKTSA